MNNYFRIEAQAWADHQAGKSMDLKPFDNDDSNKAYAEFRQLYNSHEDNNHVEA